MTQEQKAIAYDEAIRKLRGMMPNWECLSYNGKTFLQDLIHIFPELHESEDERIIKEIISIVKSYRESCITEGNHRFDNCISWLETQGKQKPAIWSEEDEARLQSCLNILQVQAKGFMGITETINTKWLKSLKQRYTWKPSDEQIDAMQMAVSYFDGSWVSKEQKLLESLYQDLKKL